MTTRIDLLFVGGGLANGLAAHRLASARPDVSTLLLEAGPTLGGNHTWSFHGGDLTPSAHAWLAPFVSARWSGTDVAFPGFRRTIGGGYVSVRSEDFHAVLSETLAGRFRTGTRVAAITGRRVTLENGEEIEASCVVDGTGWPGFANVPVAWQKFVGLELRLTHPHGLTRPVIMDATVPQLDGFRFFYLLPWDDTRVLIEDTRYSDTPDVDVASTRAEILGYVERRGWTVESEVRSEVASLAIPLDGKPDFYAHGAAVSGLRGGFFHATTGYSLPDAVRFADDFIKLPTFSGPVVAAWAHERARMHWASQGFYRLLNRLLFRAARPAERYRVLGSFYRRGEGLIERFYAGRLQGLDYLRLFTGRPPVPVGEALRVLTGREPGALLRR